MEKKHSFLFGAHMPISGGLHLAIQKGESIGCTAIQIFTKSNRQWHAKPLSQEEIATFLAAWKQSSIRSIMAHATYLINIGSPDKELEKKSVDALSVDMERCAQLNIPYLALHPGSYTTGDEAACIEQISKNLDHVLKKTPGVSILLETMAGQGSSVGHKFEQLAAIIKESTMKRRLGICFDTCHAFSAGYDFTTKQAYEALWEQFDTIIGLNKLKAFHINDSSTALGSRVDRHADIGKGKIGLKAFEMLFNDPRFFDIPKILETPKEDVNDDKRNMETIIELLSGKTKKELNWKK